MVFNSGDRFFIIETKKSFTLQLYDKDRDAWIGERGISHGYLRIHQEELDKLKFFSYNLIRIKDDKHLLELQLRY